MRHALLLVASIALGLVATDVVAAPAPILDALDAGRVACACSPRAAPPIERALVQSRIDDLMRSEGMPPTVVPMVGVRPVELDGDATTSEALVDVFAPSLCFGMSCPTIVVQRTATGDLVTRGRGLTLHAQESRTGGWADLREMAWPSTSNRTLRFSSYRYR